MTEQKRVRCPYCQKVFLCKVKPMRTDKQTINMVCPYCREDLVIKKDMLQNG